MIIKYIANYKDGTGWAKAAMYNILALDNAGHTVVPQAISYNNTDINISTSNKISELEYNNSNRQDYEIVISHVLPINYRYETSKVKNIGFVELETNSLENNYWIKQIKLMDYMGVPSKTCQKTLSKYNILSARLPHFFDFDKIFNSNKVINIEELNNSFNFLFVGEMIKRKNIEALLQAFHAEFQNFENVNLVIKTNNPSINNFCTDVKKRLKLKSKYKNEIIISQNLSDEQLYSIMRQCHINIMPSYGESWSYPILEGMALGLPALYTQGIGVEDYCTPECGLAVNSREVNCYAATDTFQDLYTGKDVWKEIDIIDLRYKMRMMFEMYKSNPQQYIDMKQSCVNTSINFDYKRSNNYVNTFLKEII